MTPRHLCAKKDPERPTSVQAESFRTGHASASIVFLWLHCHDWSSIVLFCPDEPPSPQSTGKQAPHLRPGLALKSLCIHTSYRHASGLHSPHPFPFPPTPRRCAASPLETEDARLTLCLRQTCRVLWGGYRVSEAPFTGRGFRIKASIVFVSQTRLPRCFFDLVMSVSEIVSFFPSLPLQLFASLVVPLACSNGLPPSYHLPFPLLVQPFSQPSHHPSLPPPPPASVPLLMPALHLCACTGQKVHGQVDGSTERSRKNPPL